ncbi:unnamed protein product, partial [Gulo gulo]
MDGPTPQYGAMWRNGVPGTTDYYRSVTLMLGLHKNSPS